VYAAGLALGVLGLFVPVRAPAVAQPGPRAERGTIEVETLAQRILDAPWSLRIVDLREREACAAERVPGAECVPLSELPGLGLGEAAGQRTLVLVGDTTLGELPASAQAYPGPVVTLRGGHAAWHDFALTPPSPRQAYAFRASVHGAMTGARAAPPPPAATGGAVAPKKKKKEGGCG
jgi:hypothetical protein